MNNKLKVGWREWIALPQLGITRIKAKIDTGARTSALHAFEVDPYQSGNERRVRFFIHPLQNNKDVVLECDAQIKDYRFVTDSGGHKEKRYVIVTNLSMSDVQWPIEVTLTDRDTMKFRMLLGRTAMKGMIIVDPGKSFLLGK